MKYTDEKLKEEHCKAIHNKNLLVDECSCFYCFRVFPVQSIELWVDREGDTAICPFCSVDAVIPKSDPELVRQLHEKYFGLTLLNATLYSQRSFKKVDGKWVRVK